MPKNTFDTLFDNAFVVESGCWEFYRSVNHGGYGVIFYKGRGQIASRVSYMLCVGDIPIGLCVLHTCDNRLCVNPKHLFLGTLADNVRDMVAKNRHRRKLTKEDLECIRIELENKVTHKELAIRFNVSREAITKISHRNWS